MSIAPPRLAAVLLLKLQFDTIALHESNIDKAPPQLPRAVLPALFLCYKRAYCKPDLQAGLKVNRPISVEFDIEISMLSSKVMAPPLVSAVLLANELCEIVPRT